jgi:hypothetical protein
MGTNESNKIHTTISSRHGGRDLPPEQSEGMDARSLRVWEGSPACAGVREGVFTNPLPGNDKREQSSRSLRREKHLGGNERPATSTAVEKIDKQHESGISLTIQASRTGPLALGAGQTNIFVPRKGTALHT